VLDAVLGKYEGKQTGENSLFRTLYDLLRADDVVLADRYFGGWFDLALLWQRGVHSVVRKHQLRTTDFRTGQRLGVNDHLVFWTKPQRPTWMSREQYKALPAVLRLREVRVKVEQKGFRTREVIVVTTLLDAERYRRSPVSAAVRE
jgi:putative transposase